jgi:hypothetical protein
MAVGLELGRTTVEDEAAPETTYDAARTFLDATKP